MGGIISIWVCDTTGGIRTLFAQRVDSIGQFLWNSGTPIEFVSVLNESFAWPAVPIYSDGGGGAIYLWNELQAGMFMKQISNNGILGEVITGVNTKSNMASSEYFQLSQNYPNPFNSSTTIDFKIQKSTTIKLTIYTITGQIINILIDRFIIAGNHRIIWNAKDNKGNNLASGIYIYELIGDNWKISKKLLLMR